MRHDLNSVTQIRPREPAGLSSRDSLELAAFQQFQLDYEAELSGSGRQLRSVSFLPADKSSPVQIAWPAPEEGAPMYFEVFLTDLVRLTSTRFSGGDWCWRFCTAQGVAVAYGGGYRNEAECMSAIQTIQRSAGSALIKHR